MLPMGYKTDLKVEKTLELPSIVTPVSSARKSRTTSTELHSRDLKHY